MNHLKINKILLPKWETLFVKKTVSVLYFVSFYNKIHIRKNASHVQNVWLLQQRSNFARFHVSAAIFVDSECFTLEDGSIGYPET